MFMDKIFNDLVGMYHQAKDDNKLTAAEKQAEIINQMKENLIKRNGGNDFYGSKSISNASYVELREIDGTMNREASSQLMTDLSNKVRKKQTDLNKFGENNPYDNK